MNWVPLILLFIGIGITSVAGFYEYLLTAESENAQFTEESDLIFYKFTERIKEYQNLLYASKAFIESSDSIEFDEWELFSESTAFNSRFNDAITLAYVEPVSEKQSDSFEIQMQQIIPDFQIHPRTTEQHYVIKYIAPYQDSLKPLLGYDNYSELKRRHCIEDSLRTNLPQLSEIITLNQDTNPTHASIYCIPFYSKNSNDISNERNIGGFVTLAFRYVKIFDGINLSDYQITIYNNNDDLSQPIFSYNEIMTDSKFSKSYPFDYGGRNWKITLERINVFDFPYGVLIILLSGYIVSFVIYFLIKKNTLNIQIANDQRLAKLRSDFESNLKINELIQDSKEKNQVTSVFTHESKNQIFPILIECEMLQDPQFSNNLNYRQKEMIKNIENSTKRLQIMLHDMLSLQKSFLIDQKIEKNSFNSLNYAEELKRIYEPMMVEKNINFIITCSDFEIYSNKNKISQVLSNLIMNSIDFVPKTNGIIKLSLENSEENWSFSVEDNGVGISNEDQSKLFLYFFTENKEATRKYGGTGLGLPICKLIVEQLGGKIWVESELGKGTMFLFVIPKSDSK